jgi:hypothetical protein
VGENIYQGTWEEMVGTELYTDNDAKVFAKSRMRIVLRPGQLLDRSEAAAAEGAASSSYWGSKKETLVDKIREMTLKRLEKHNS